jgi:ABC-type nickel/cobalt efflux system permease component RcnA
MLALIFVAGVLHGLGPDHLVAITAVAGAGGSLQRITSFSARFAFGHAIVILLVGSAAFFGRRFLPPLWERNFELLAGGLLVCGGIVLITGLVTKRFSLHRHAHGHGPEQHSHMHLHVGRAERHRHVHGISTVLLGGLFALGGSSSMLAATSAVLAQNGLEFFLRIAAFTAGIVISMTGFGMVTRALLNRGKASPEGDPLARMPRLSFATACLCIVAGAWTIFSRVQS